MKTTVYTFYEKTIIDNIDFEGYDIEEPKNLHDKINALHKIFMEEYGWAIKRYGKQKAFSEWLSGLPTILTVPFYYNDILNNAEAFGLQIKEEDIFLNDYFDNLSKAFFTLYNNL